VRLALYIIRGIYDIIELAELISGLYKLTPNSVSIENARNNILLPDDGLGNRLDGPSDIKYNNIGF
jgi:hypothetical protein